MSEKDFGQMLDDKQPITMAELENFLTAARITFVELSSILKDKPDITRNLHGDIHQLRDVAARLERGLPGFAGEIERQLNSLQFFRDRQLEDITECSPAAGRAVKEVIYDRTKAKLDNLISRLRVGEKEQSSKDDHADPS